jgi:Amt family ammonium transporter
VARFGGDEFVVVLTGARSSREIMHVAHRLAEVLRRPYLIDGHSVASSASIGIELALADGLTPDEMIRNASLAMLHAKDMGSRHPKVFSRRLQDSLASLQVVETELLGAIEGGQLVIALQPIVDAADDCRPMGFEVLSRWHHPVRGVIPPGSFIPVAEESGLIVRLGEWVLRSACAVLADWRLESGRAEDIFLSVNVSPRQLSRSGFVPLVRDLLAEFELPPAQLQLEFTETALMESSPQVQERLRELSDLGVRLAIDDFGTGYSNMALLTRLPLTDLKIDLSIVAGAERKPESRAILRAIATMARSLGLEVIAEGVETPAQRDILIGLGCRLHQGFLHGRPMPEPEARRLLSG